MRLPIDPFATTDSRTLNLRTWTFIPQGIPGDAHPVKIDATYPMDEETARARLAARGTPVDGWVGQMKEKAVHTEPADAPPSEARRFRVTFRREQTLDVEVEACSREELLKNAKEAFLRASHGMWESDGTPEIDNYEEIKR